MTQIVVQLVFSFVFPVLLLKYHVDQITASNLEAFAYLDLVMKCLQ
jgi:hypothetical protein